MKEKYFKLDIMNKKYRNFLIVSYTAVAAAAIAIMTVFLFSWFNGYIQNVIFDMSTIQLNNLNNSVYYTFNSCHTQLQSAWQEPDIKNYMYAQGSDAEREYKISRYLQNLCISNGLADYICVFRGEDDFTYYGSRFPDEAEMQQLKEKIFETESDSQFFLLQDLKKDSLCLFITNRQKLDSPPQNGLIYALDLDKLRKQLVSETSENVSFFIFDQDGNSLLNSGITADETDIVWKWIDGQTQNQSGMEIALNQKRSLLTFQFDPKNGLYFVMVQDYQLIREHISEMRKTVYLSIFICFFAVLALSWQLARFLYIPLKNFFIRLNTNASLVKVDDSYSKKQTEISSEKILSQINVMSQQYHTDKVLRYLENAAGSEEIPPVLRLTDRNEQCLLLLFWTDSASINDALPEEVHRRLSQTLSGCKVSLFADARNPWFLILVKENRQTGRLKDISRFFRELLALNKSLRQETGAALYCAVSDLLQTEEHLSESFEDLLFYTKYQLLGTCSPVMGKEICPPHSEADIPRKLYDELLEDVRRGREQSAIERIPALLDRLGDYEIRRGLLFLAEMCAQMKQCAGGTEWTGRQKLEGYLDHYIKITSMYNRAELENYLRQLIQEVCLENRIFSEKAFRLNMLDAIAFISDHYRDSNMSVELVAEQFHISVSYFSKLFNEYVGMTFPEYINDLRLTYARELLKSNPDISIKKTAEICGFSGVSYFSAQFKKKFGVSPSGIRN